MEHNLELQVKLVPVQVQEQAALPLDRLLSSAD